MVKEAAGAGLPNTVHPDKYVHAKFISAILLPKKDRRLFGQPFLPEGGPIVLTGSHNFHRAGILAGTKEIALLSTQKSIVDDINQWADSRFLSYPESC